MGVGTKESPCVDWRRNQFELFVFERIEVLARDSSVALGIFDREAAGLAGVAEAGSQFSHYVRLGPGLPERDVDRKTVGERTRRIGAIECPFASGSSGHMADNYLSSPRGRPLSSVVTFLLSCKLSRAWKSALPAM